MHAVQARVGVGLVLLASTCGCRSSAGTVAGEARSGERGGSVLVQTVSPAQRGAALGLRGTTTAGQPLDSATLSGRVVVVNAWGSWCPPCVEEAPALVRAARALSADGVAFVGVDVKDSPATADAFLRRVGAAYPSFRYDGGRVVQQLGGWAPAPPTTLVLDRRGRVAARVLSSVTERTLDDLVDDVLAEPAP